MSVVRGRALTAGVALALAVGTAGPAAASLEAPSLDLSTREAVEGYLRSLGIDPSNTIFQEGLNNYAGPDCPGIGWTCTDEHDDDDRPVVQWSWGGGKNTFHCSPASSGTDPADNRCVVVQVNVTGENNAKCIMKDSAQEESQECSITQQNSRGNNHAQVHLTITQYAVNRSAQTADQQATVSQSNESGNNNSHVYETVAQWLWSWGGSGQSITQQQGAHLAVDIGQDSTTGNNASFIDQRLSQKAEAKGGAAITQGQNATNDGPDLEADVEQDSDSGKNDSKLSEDIDQFAKATSGPGPVDQMQSSADGGSDAAVDQFSSGVATAGNVQNEKQTLQSQTQGPLSQTQFGPQRCCTFQLDNPNNRFKIDQVSVQTAGENADQFNEMEGTCVSSGTCTVHQRVTQNGETTENSCQGSACNVFVLCLPAGICITLDLPPDEGLTLT